MLAPTDMDAEFTLAASPAAASSLDATRAFDIAVALVALIFFAPLMLIIAAMVRFSDDGPILFGHRRIGRNGRDFRCWKFRTMVVDAEARLAELIATDPAAAREWARTHKLRHDPRITAIGRFLRRTSLDELPQLFNVLCGEMGMVGPRPIVTAEIRHYGRHFSEYASVRPGLTGLWQVSRRDDTTYRRRVALDVMYARRRSLMLDGWLVVATVPALLRQRGSH